MKKSEFKEIANQYLYEKSFCEWLLKWLNYPEYKYTSIKARKEPHKRIFDYFQHLCVYNSECSDAHKIAAWDIFMVVGRAFRCYNTSGKYKYNYSVIIDLNNDKPIPCLYVEQLCRGRKYSTRADYDGNSILILAISFALQAFYQFVNDLNKG